MDTSLLKKTAIQCIALMIAVITFSYALKQYQTITIQANGQIIGEVVHDIHIEDSKSSLYDRNYKVDQTIKQKLGMNYLMIKKPEGKKVEITLDDLYRKQSIGLTISGSTDKVQIQDIIRIQGDQVYRGYPLEANSSSSIDIQGGDPCKSITITQNKDPETKSYTDKILLQLDKIYAYIIYEDATNFYIDLRKPSEVYDKIIVIDAGHGGKDSGAISKNGNYYEKNINLDIITQLQKLLNESSIKVYYTRIDDSTTYLKQRSNLANMVDCDYFISIHCNANDSSSPNGSEILYTNKQLKGIFNEDLANLFSRELESSIPLKNRGIVKKNHKDVYIMDKALVPMVLIEVGYVTNNKDMNFLSKLENRKTIAKGIYHGIMKAYEQLPVVQTY